MNTLWKLMEKSTLTSGVLAVILVGTASYCAITQTPVPEYLSVALGTVIGFFFSSKMSDAAARKAS